MSKKPKITPAKPIGLKYIRRWPASGAKRNPSVEIPESALREAQEYAKRGVAVTTAPNIGIAFDGTRYRFFMADAWKKPKTRGFLPWSPPAWPRLAVVTPTGKVRYDVKSNPAGCKRTVKRNPTTGAVTYKLYKCVHPDCGHEYSVQTNHYGEIYSKCPKCYWKGTSRVHRSVCLEPVPAGMSKLPEWKQNPSTRVQWVKGFGYPRTWTLSTMATGDHRVSVVFTDRGTYQPKLDYRPFEYPVHTLAEAKKIAKKEATARGWIK